MAKPIFVLLKNHFSAIHKRDRTAVPKLIIIIVGIYGGMWAQHYFQPEWYLESRYVRIVPVLLWIYPVMVLMLIVAFVFDVIRRDKEK